jgi:pyruvate dehydrogenase E2 component (dihydrolipoamide acetyltransferase)
MEADGPATAAAAVPPLGGSSAASEPAASTARDQTARASAAAARPAGGMFARNRAAAAANAPPVAGIALSVAERTAGKRLQESKQTIPHFYLQTSVNAAAMIARREAAKPAKLAWEAFFVLAVAKSIAKFERFCCRLDGERLTPIDTDAIGVAVDIGGELYVIPVAAPTTKTVERISEEIRQGVERLRNDPEARRTRPALMTVTNLGVCNVEGFIPIISPPEPAILGVGRVAATPVVRADGQIGVQQRCTITLCVDHRVCSGKYAGEFLGAIVKELESL